MKEIILICGIQAAGKSHLVLGYVAQKCHRVNRDEMCGSLDDCNVEVERQIKLGKERIVMDNTYGTKEQRAPVIALAKKNGYKITCVWLKTSIEDAQFNASKRILSLAAAQDRNPNGSFFKIFDVNTSQVLGPECTKYVKAMGVVPSIAQFAYQKKFEKPTTDEGFDRIEEVPFVRSLSSSQYNNKAILVDYDGTLRDTISGEKYPKNPNDIKILPNRAATLKMWADKGYLILGVSNQSGVEKGDLTEEQCIACFEKTNELLGMKIHYKFCPHHSFPIRCYCRKPLPGLGVYFIEAYGLSPKDCIMVGNATSDKTFSKRCGFQYQDAKDFFA